MSTFRWIPACALALCALGAWAEPPASDKAADDGKLKKVAPKMPKSMGKSNQLEELIVVGKLQKPEVFYVLGRTDFAYKGLELQENFLERIGKSVKGNPF